MLLRELEEEGSAGRSLCLDALVMCWSGEEEMYGRVEAWVGGWVGGRVEADVLRCFLAAVGQEGKEECMGVDERVEV